MKISHDSIWNKFEIQNNYCELNNKSLCPFSFEWIRNFNKVNIDDRIRMLAIKIALGYKVKISIPFFGLRRYLFLVIMTNLSSNNVIWLLLWHLNYISIFI